MHVLLHVHTKLSIYISLQYHNMHKIYEIFNAKINIDAINLSVMAMGEGKTIPLNLGVYSVV